jgi:hypothetical protein
VFCNEFVNSPSTLMITFESGYNARLNRISSGANYVDDWRKRL